MFQTDKIFSVSEFNTILKQILNELGTFAVSGEITELSVTQNKGVYITISDGKSNLRVSGYAPAIKGMNLVEKGMQVVVKGFCDIYVPYGSFSLSISSIEPEGEGALAIAYEKLKKDLESKGYFDIERKKELPKYITKIALLTGKDSAAYSDFVKILKEHTAGLQVDFYPVVVQGDHSVKSILDTLNKIYLDDYDAVVLTRGGGSLEDLKSFNDIEIADTILKSKIPFIVGVGHEKDESIAEFVADFRASTPSQCAYYILDQNNRFIDSIKELTEEIYENIKTQLFDRKNTLFDIDTQVLNSITNIIESMKSELSFMRRLLDSYDVEKVMKRGFAIICLGKFQIKSVGELEIDQNIEIRMKDGKAFASINQIDK